MSHTKQSHCLIHVLIEQTSEKILKVYILHYLTQKRVFHSILNEYIQFKFFIKLHIHKKVHKIRLRNKVRK